MQKKNNGLVVHMRIVRFSASQDQRIIARQLAANMHTLYAVGFVIAEARFHALVGSLHASISFVERPSSPSPLNAPTFNNV